MNASFEKSVSKLKLSWQCLANVDEQLVETHVDTEEIRGHKIDVDPGDVTTETNVLKNFLDGQYKLCLEKCELRTVSYLPAFSFSPLGIFSAEKIAKGTCIPGLSGFLSIIESSEVQVNYNDFSLIESTLLKKQWLMLGPISFVNHSCKPNAKYSRVGSVMKCIAVREIDLGEEILVLYDRNYCSDFNHECCCLFKTLHSNPCPPSPEPCSKKKKNNKTVEIPQLEQRAIPKRIQLSNSEICTRFSCRERFCSDTSDEGENDFVDYDNLNGQFELIETAADEVTEAPYQIEPSDNSELENHIEPDSPPANASLIEAFSHVADIMHVSPPNLESTPVSLHEFEDSSIADIKFYSVTELMEDDDCDDELFIGSHLSTGKFFRIFDFLRDKHKHSKIAKDDFLKLFSDSLPRPNNINSRQYITFLPNITVAEGETSSIVCIDLLTQLKKIIEQNLEYIKLSWRSCCTWADPVDNFRSEEVQLVFNLDGASVFKSRNTSIWPVWVQVFNLPPLLRSSVKNMALLAVWHGQGKPDFKSFLDKIVFEIKTILHQSFEFERIGKLRSVARSLVCDMPATAYSLCMYQHMGFFSCTFCLMKGIRHNNRTLFPVKAPFLYRTKNPSPGVLSNQCVGTDQF